MSGDVECPYCDKWQEVCHDDGFGYEEDLCHEMMLGKENMTISTLINIAKALGRNLVIDFKKEVDK